MIAIQIKESNFIIFLNKKIKFYYIKNIIIPLGPTSLRSTSLGPTSAGPSGDSAGVAVEKGEGASTSRVGYECEHHRLSSDAIPTILDI